MTENNEAEGGPMQTVLNVRMDSTLKERGDKVLSENGISVSAAVRALWAELAKTRTRSRVLAEARGGRAAQARASRCPRGAFSHRLHGALRKAHGRRQGFARCDVRRDAERIQGVVVKVLVDTNVWLDILVEREPFCGSRPLPLWTSSSVAMR